jgi:hypothetical protein
MEGDQTQVQIQAGSSSLEGGQKFDIKRIGRNDQPLDASLHRFEVERKPGMTDADVKADVERQMREADVEGAATIEVVTGRTTSPVRPPRRCAARSSPRPTP